MTSSKADRIGSRHWSPAAREAVTVEPGQIAPAVLRRLQLTQLDIAARVARLCDAEGIAYVFLGGSALGARRHSGFIPWDDDMDFGMLRADFDRFVEVARRRLPSSLYLQYWLDDPHMGVPFAKVRINDTVLVEEGSRATGGHKGIAIDIFPFDNVPAGIVRYPWMFALKLLRRTLRHQTGYTLRDLPLPALLADSLVRLMARATTPAATRKLLHSLMTRYARLESLEVLAVGGAYDFRKDRLERNWLTDRRRLRFERREFYCPRDINAYLAHMYGDFMSLPPIEERVSRHALIELRFRPEPGLEPGPESAPDAVSDRDGEVDRTIAETAIRAAALSGC